MRKNVQYYKFENGCFKDLEEVIENNVDINIGIVVYFIDSFFNTEEDEKNLPNEYDDIIIYVNNEPKIEDVDKYVKVIIDEVGLTNSVGQIVAIGGGSTLDTAKAVSIMLTNTGKTEDYVGYNLVKEKAIFKIGIPTISGTGAEVSRTAVLFNEKTKIKHGINDDESVFDVLLLDPSLTKSVPKEQFFYTGMDCYIHCIEALEGKNRNFINDEYGELAKTECEYIFDGNIETEEYLYGRMMYSSYIGGFCAGTTGVIHPIAAGLSTLNIKHGESVVLALNALKEYYEIYWLELKRWLKINDIKLRKNVCNNLTKEQWDIIYKAVLVHSKPLKNHLGSNWKKIMTKKKIKEIMIKI